MTTTDYRRSDVLQALVLPIVVLSHLFLSPYTKVEESFNIQAVHDILAYGVPLRNSSAILNDHFDHVDFPGSVPRTFVGALLLSGLTRPLTTIIALPVHTQLTVRAVLGLANAYALWSVRTAVDTAYGKTAGWWYIWIQASQFHVMYYASRTLPNMFAFFLTTIAVREMILLKAVATKSHKASQRRRLALCALTVAGVIFRSEVAILLAAETVLMIIQHHPCLTRDVIPAGLQGAAIGVAATVSVDSFFWQQFPLWPELKGFYFNTIQGKSSEWGTSPFHYYLSNALPRLLLNPLLFLICIPMAIALKATRKTSINILLPHVVFILIYSILPHKEWRFIIYSIPAFNAVASAAPAWMWTRRSKSVVYRLSSFLMMGGVALSFLTSIALSYVSSLNYPGGEALVRLHEIAATEPESIGVKVYLDNLACQTGVTRFQQSRPDWTYDKTESSQKLLDPIFWQEFDFAIVEHPERVIGLWEPVATISGFAGVTLRPDDGSDILPLSALLREGPLEWLHTHYLNFAQHFRQRVTRGYWPAVRTVPKLFILKREIPSLLPRS